MQPVRLIAVVVVGLAVLLATSCSSSPHSATIASTSTSAVRGGATSATNASPASTSTTRPLSATSAVIGRANGAPPCAPARAGRYFADVRHPERAPIQAEAEFAHGVRWAICGADVTFSSELLNLRSADNGKTWRVTDTGFGISPHHAGDHITIRLMTASRGSVRLRSYVGEFDDTYTTTDGGHAWQRSCSFPRHHPCP